MTRHIALIVISAACLIGLACTGTTKPLVKASGKIAFDNGRPLPLGTVVRFDPQEGRVGTASGTVSADGTFTVTHASGAAGIEIAAYTVTLLPAAGTAEQFTIAVPARYRENFLTTIVTAETTVIDLTVPSR